MNSGYLWQVSSDNIPERIASKEKPEPSDVYDWQEFPVVGPGGEPVHIIKIACTPTSVFALDREGNVYIFVYHSHLAVRHTVTTYSNQRWFPAVGWCSFTLPTERSTFSNEDGSQRLSFNTFSLKSDGWRWEEPWMVTLDMRKYDKEGWEYAFNFGKKVDWTRYQKRTSLVRRRLFRRTMRYVAIDTWVQMPMTNSAHVFLDICAGNFQRASGYVDLFALSETGNIFYRKNVGSSSPEGVEWVPIDGIKCEDGWEDISMIGSSPAHPCLFALSWDGRLFTRCGMTISQPQGMSWKAISFPGSQPITGFALGNQVLWVVSAKGQVFNASVSVSIGSGITITSQLRPAGEGMCRMSATATDQVFAVSNGFEQLHVRSELTKEEPYGRRWVPVVHRDSEKQRTLQPDGAACVFSASTIPPPWTDPNFVPMSLDMLHIRNAQWRRTILHRLREEEERCWSAFRKFSDGPETETARENARETLKNWMKTERVAAIIHETGLLNWADGVICMDDSKIEVQLKRGTVWREAFGQILSLYPTAMDKRDYVLCIFYGKALSSKKVVAIAFTSDELRNHWIDFLQKSMRSCAVSLPRDRLGQWAWSVTSGGIVRCHLMSQMRETADGQKPAGSQSSYPCLLSSAPSFLVQGHLTQVSAGADRIVWAIGKDHSLYALDSRYDPLDDETEFTHVQYDRDIEYVVEYEKYSIFRGYVSFEGCGSGVWASTDLEGRPRQKNKKLESGWSWEDDDWSLSKDWEYAVAINGEYGVDDRRGRARRRLWSRRKVYRGVGPWIKVDSPPAASVHIQRGQNDRVLVWVVTVSGEVLVRYGCCRSLPQGDDWLHVYSDFSIRLLSLASPTKVWAVSKDNRLLLRECANPADIDKFDWQEVSLGSVTDAPLAVDALDMTSSDKVLWILTPRGLTAISLDNGNYFLYSVVTQIPMSRIVLDRDGILHVAAPLEVYRRVGALKKVRGSRTTTDYEVTFVQIDMPRISCLSIY